MKFQNGITLIALVITVVISLILSTIVFYSAFGNNGILEKAQTSTYISSCGELEDFLKMYYLENYIFLDENNNKLNFLQTNTDWIYNPSKEGIGLDNYVVTSEKGYKVYLLNKKNLIKSTGNFLNIKGGDAGEGTYLDYMRMNDVYGVTEDLKVFYCYNEKNIVGIDINEIEKENLNRIIFEQNSSIANLINNGDEITLQKAREITSISINGENGIDLKQLYNFTTLKKLEIDNYSGSLDGIENCMNLSEILLKNCNISNYTAIGKLGNKITKLYIQQMGNDEIKKLCSESLGIANYDLSNLQYFAIVGNVPSYNYDNTTQIASSRNSYENTDFYDIDLLSNLSEKTKKAVKYLYLNNNSLESLGEEKIENGKKINGGILDFSSVVYLRCEQNLLNDINGIKNMNNLTYLLANNNKLGFNEEITSTDEESAISALENVTKLTVLYLQNNTYLKKIKYIASNINLQRLYLAGDSQLIEEDVVLIKDVYNKCHTAYRSIDRKYISLMNSVIRIDLSNCNLTDTSSELDDLKDNLDCEQLNLSNNPKLTDDKLQEILSSMKNLKYLKLTGLTNLASIDFLEDNPNIVELDLRNTAVTDLSLLDDNEMNLKALWINNEAIDLTKFQKAISRLGNPTNSFQNAWNTTNPGLGITNVNLYKKLEDCTEITSYTRYCAGYLYEDLDLSRCTKLTYMFSSCAGSKIKIPSSVTTIKYDREYVPNISNASNLQTFTISWCEWKQDELDTFCSQLSALSKIRSITINFADATTATYIAPINNTGITTLSIGVSSSSQSAVGKIVDISGISNTTGLTNFQISRHSNLSDITPISSLTNLNTLVISKCNVSDISALKNLTNLKTVNLSNNRISNLVPLKGHYQIGNGNVSSCYLNLSNNAIYNKVTYYENDVEITEDNIEILADLNKNGYLRSLYLSGNDGITDFSALTQSTTWNKNYCSGF